ncbi:MAG: stage II sporulation protein R [Clostridia bacterium]|nr:stage II sporulation protein R [Clostridia bacterium]
MHCKKLQLIELSVLAAFLLTILLQTAAFCRGCENVYANMLRLHVIANSDSERDQRLKLLVRDTLLREGAEIFDGSANVSDAKEKLEPHFDALEQAAENALRENGCADPVHITLEKSYFDTRTYGQWTVPAGIYEAVCVRIGNAAGHNWWCVMFPPLCLPAACAPTDAVFNANGKAVLGSNPKYDVRFKVVEWVQKAKQAARKDSLH